MISNKSILAANTATTMTAVITTTDRFNFDVPICYLDPNAIEKKIRGSNTRNHIITQLTFLLRLVVLYRERSWHRATLTDVASFGIWPHAVASLRRFVPMVREGDRALRYAALVLAGKMRQINSFIKLVILSELYLSMT